MPKLCIPSSDAKSPFCLHTTLCLLPKYLTKDNNALEVIGDRECQSLYLFPYIVNVWLIYHIISIPRAAMRLSFTLTLSPTRRLTHSVKFISYQLWASLISMPQPRFIFIPHCHAPCIYYSEIKVAYPSLPRNLFISSAIFWFIP